MVQGESGRSPIFKGIEVIVFLVQSVEDLFLMACDSVNSISGKAGKANGL